MITPVSTLDPSATGVPKESVKPDSSASPKPSDAASTSTPTAGMTDEPAMSATPAASAPTESALPIAPAPTMTQTPSEGTSPAAKTQAPASSKPSGAPVLGATAPPFAIIDDIERPGATKAPTKDDDGFTEVEAGSLGKPGVSSVKASNGKIKIKIKKVRGAKGYRLQYSTSKKFKKKNTRSINSKGVKIIISKVKKGKTYYIRACAYKLKKGKKKFGKWGKIVKVKAK